jgi:uncharacterized protein YeaO (DUF488 family)
MLKVFTSRISYRGEDRWDITVKTGSKLFAPSWKIVMNYKNGKITEQEYTVAYYEIMKASSRDHRSEWTSLLAKDRIVLCCYCPAGVFCHRLLLAKLLAKLGAEYEGEI